MDRDVLRQLPHAVISTDVHGRVQTWNHAASKLFGYAAEEAVGRPIGFLCPSDDRAALDGVSAGRDGPVVTTLRLRRRCGEVLKATVHLLPLRSEGGELAGMLLWSDGPADDREAEPAPPARSLDATSEGGRRNTPLHETPSMTRRMIEHLPAGAVYVDRDRIDINEAVERITGYRRSELTTLDRWFAAMFGDERHRVRKLYEDDRAAGFPRPRALSLIRKDGEERLVEFAAYRSKTDEIWLLHDVTERTRAEVALRESEERLRAIVNTAADGIITIDANGRIESFNPAAERIFGYDAAEVIGQSVSLLMPSPLSERHSDYISEYLKTGQRKIIGIGREVIARRKDGTTFPIDLAVSEIRDGGQPKFTGILRDISDRKRAEEQLRHSDRLASIGTLVAGLGHDMNNVLLPVRSRLDVLDATELPVEAHEHVTGIRKSAEYLQHLTDSLHLVSLDPTDEAASDESTSLSAWWDQVRPLLSRSLPKHVRLGTAIPADLGPVAIAPHRLTQAVLNLLVNSGEAVGEEGMVRIWAESCADGSFVCLGVTDNGEGMTAEVKQRALDPFFTTKTRGLGTGLGLSLVHGVVTSAGGSVQIDSQAGRGTTVLLRLPTTQLISPPTPPRGISRSAVVTIADARMATIIGSFLEASGMLVAYGEGADPATSAIWATEAGPGTFEAVRRYLGRGGRRAIICGTTATEWEDVGAIVIENVNDFELVRGRIGQATRELMEAAP